MRLVTTGKRYGYQPVTKNHNRMYQAKQKREGAKAIFRKADQDYEGREVRSYLSAGQGLSGFAGQHFMASF